MTLPCNLINLDQDSMEPFVPAYVRLHEQGLLEKRVRQAERILRACRLCPRQCGVDRTSGQKGFCRTGSRALVSSYNPHFGEEDPLVGKHGSGTIFFAGCNLLCLFCQNFDVSHGHEGVAFSAHDMADAMLVLQSMGCANINLVTPSHVVPQILAALAIAVEKGLRVPLVYNSGGYDRVDTLGLLDGVVDIYMPDFKFWDPAVAKRLCDAPDYPEVARKAVREMHRQVRDLVINNRGLAERGVLIRHLVLPEAMAGTRQVMRFLARQVSRHSYVNVMAQYRPCGRAAEVPGLGRQVTTQEYQAAVEAAKQEGIRRLDERKRTFLVQWF